MATKKFRVDFFYDVVSPYSWFSFEGLTRYRSIWPMDLRLRPFYLSGVVKDNPAMPLSVPMKEKYAYKDLPRSAKHWGVPFVVPEDFKKTVTTRSSVGAQRLLVALNTHAQKWEEPVARALWTRFFAQGKGFFEQDDLVEVLNSVGVPDAAKYLELANTAEIKTILKENTAEARATGCFGAPWTHVHTPNGIEPFFGSDRLPFIADMMGLPYNGPMIPKH